MGCVVEPDGSFPFIVGHYVRIPIESAAEVLLVGQAGIAVVWNVEFPFGAESLNLGFAVAAFVLLIEIILTDKKGDVSKGCMNLVGIIRVHRRV